MDLYEHQGKDVFRSHGIPTPRGIVAATPEQAADATVELGGRSVVKVQVQIGGRGKGGGVVLVDSPERAAEEAGRMFRDGFQDMVVNLKPELTPWLWGINGAASVLCSVLAIVVALSAGITASFWFGVACYVAALAAYWLSTRRPATVTT